MKLDRILNALRYAAVADAAAYQYEFSDRNDISLRLDQSLPISDDTQMTLFSLQAVKDIIVGKDPQLACEQAYIQWYLTQTQNHRCGEGLLAHRGLYVQRAPGHTCVTALEALSSGKRVENRSYGSGSVMRLLPFVALFEFFDRDRVIEIAKISAAVTHKHELNHIAVEALMETYHWALYGGRLQCELECDSNSGRDAVSCVAAAVRAVHDSFDFKSMIEWCIRNTEDCDTVAAVAGGIWGLLHSAPCEYQVKESVILESEMKTFKEFIQEAKQVGVLYVISRNLNDSFI